MHRRDFLRNTTLAGAAIGIQNQAFSYIPSENMKDKIRLGIIGVGARGYETLKLALYRKDVTVTSVCDIDPNHAARAEKAVVEAGHKKPALYTRGDYDYRRMLHSKELDAVLICTPWEWHTPMSVDAMRMGIAVGCEVAGAASVEECWQMVRTQESTGTPFMIMENVCYRRDVMAALNMVRQGLFGELVHLEGGYQHDLREVKFNDGKQYYGGGVEFGEKGYSEARWRTQHSVYRNGDLYPTHGIGPIGSFINNNRGNRFVSLTSMASKARGLHQYIMDHPQGGASHPNATIQFRLGDVVTTSIQTAMGETIVLSHDTSLPRPYSLGFRVQGVKGLWMDINKSVHIEGRSPAHKWEPADAYFKTYDHPLWRKYEKDAADAGHGGMDWFVLHAFVEALKNNEPMPLDVYDHASWAVITCLSEQSISQGGAVQSFPDFTDGRWINRKPVFALDDRY
ncbi:MAG: Gfo/Idh/MocA family oxidoreductase [Saprospiraceae bacterium]|nr:Gfo/Idh/MocA family oxidoreductase [Saprospiraceae bacterium]